MTPDGVVRLIYCFVPEKGAKKANTWTTSKLEALEASLTCWTTMRSRTKLQQYTHRPSRKDYGTPKFSGKTKGQWVDALRKLGLLVDSKTHPYYRKATDSEE